jgi:MFS family permease
MALINEFYHDDEKKCSMVIGNFSASTALIGAVMSIIAGLLCSIRWDFVFYEYLAAIPILVLMIIFIPRTPPEKETGSRKKESAASEKIPAVRVTALIGSLFVVGVLFGFMAYQCSMYVDQTELGTSVFAGVLSGVVTVSTAIACFIFAAIYACIKRGTAVLIYAFLAVGFFVGSFILNQAWAVLCFTLLGFGYGLAMSYFYMHATVIVPPSKASFVLCLVAADVGLGTFLSSYFSTSMMTIFKFSELISLLPIYACIAVIGGILSIILTIRSRKLATK